MHVRPQSATPVRPFVEPRRLNRPDSFHKPELLEAIQYPRVRLERGRAQSPARPRRLPPRFDKVWRRVQAGARPHLSFRAAGADDHHMRT